MTIHSYKHTGDIPAASISEKYFPPSGTVDISLFVYKSFAVMPWTHLKLDLGESLGVRSRRGLNMPSLTMQNPCVIPVKAEKKGRSRKVRKGERQAANRQELRKKK